MHLGNFFFSSFKILCNAKLKVFEYEISSLKNLTDDYFNHNLWLLTDRYSSSFISIYMYC